MVCTYGSTALFLLLLATAATRTHGSHMTMQPLPGKSKSSDGRDAAIIILPETGVIHTDYTLLGRRIQQLYPARLWLSLLDTASEGSLTLDNLPLLLGESMTELESAGMTESADIFLAAHGHPGQVAADYAQAVPSTLRGLILLGTFLPKRFSLDLFPLPVLTLVGEVDGVVRITRLAQMLRSVVTAQESEPSLVTHSPVVVLEGANHDVFILGELPPWLHNIDIEAQVDKNVSMTTASNLTAIFIANVLQKPMGLADAEQVFKATFEYAVNVTEPITSLMEMTQDNLKSYWVKSAQKWLSGLEGKHSTQLEVDSYIVSDRVPLPPALVKEHGINYVITFSDINHGQQNGDSEDSDSEANPQAPEEIAARMVGPERIHEYLQDTTIARNYTCRDLNYASFMTAYHTASEAARIRYDNHHRGVIFEPDIVTDSEVLWETTRLKLETVSRVLHVTSISYKTANDLSLSQYAGLFFCKLLPPDRALEWIYVDSLRRSVS
ncbi:hypothetical protein BsWGS_07901 [Bradybaena similaris]